MNNALKRVNTRADFALWLKAPGVLSEFILRWGFVAVLLVFSACGSQGDAVVSSDTMTADTLRTNDRSDGTSSCPDNLPYTSELVSFVPGPNAGFGDSQMPDVVLGPPLPGPPRSGSLDVLSLGVGGEIVLGFGERMVVDGPGPDIVIWENAFWVGGDSEKPFAELGEVSVSLDGDTWHTFSCDAKRDDGFDDGCAGWRPRNEFDPCTLVPIDAAQVGGDQFDLADLGLEKVRYVRIRDLAESGEPPSAGFDLDAVGAIHLE